MENIDEVLKSHKLTQDDYQHILTILGREPNLLEIGIFSAMWMEQYSEQQIKHYIKVLSTYDQ